MSRDPKFSVAEFNIWGDICRTCEIRWCLPTDRATCTHKDVCESCWPNGCDECELSVLPEVCS
jgi:hypothetical protein